LDRFGFAALTILDRPEQGLEFVELPLRDAHIVQDGLGEGCEMGGGCDQPLQHRVGIDLEHPGDRAEAHAFRQRAHRPYQQVGRDALAIQRRATRLQKIRLTLAAIQLSPRAAARMTMRTEIAPSPPAALVAGRSGTERLRGVQLTWPSPAGGDRRRWEGRWQSRWCLRRLRTGRTGGLVSQARKRLRVAGALARRQQRLRWPLIPCGTLVVWPGIMPHDAEPEESQEQQLGEKEVGYHGKTPSHR